MSFLRHLKFKIVHPTHGCVPELTVCMNEIDFAEDGTSMSFKNDIPFTMPPPCSYSGKIPANTTISLTPRNDWGGGFGANGFMKGWGHAIDINVPITLLDGNGNPTSSQLAEGSISSAVSVTSGRNLMPKLAEWHIYGNGEQGRFAIKKPDQGDIYYLDPLHTDFVNKKFSRILGSKEYEIKDHLGNVRTAITDYKLPQNPDPTAQPRGVMPFSVDEKAVNDYYPYGMLIPERSWSSADYRYGYNTQEKSLEIDPHGNHTTAEFWEYDARSVKRWNRDPKPITGISDYAINKNNPISNIDPKGDDPVTAILEGVTAVGIEVGLDFMTNIVVKGQDANTAFNNVNWKGALWEGGKAFGISILTPTGSQTIARIAKVSQSAIGKLTTSFVENMTNDVLKNYFSGKYNDKEGNFDYNLLKNDFTDLTYTAGITTLLEAGMGDKAKELYKNLEKSNSKLAKQYEKLFKNLDSPGSTQKTIDDRVKKINEAAKVVGKDAVKATGSKAKQEAVKKVGDETQKKIRGKKEERKS